MVSLKDILQEMKTAKRENKKEFDIELTRDNCPNHKELAKKIVEYSIKDIDSYNLNITKTSGRICFHFYKAGE